MSAGHLFCFGLGYSAAVIARRLVAQGWSVSGTCREPGKAGALDELGISLHRFDGLQRIVDDAAFAGVTHVLSSIPPDATGDPSLAHHAGDLERIGGSLQWMGYLSTTGVYGDQQGRWIDETCPTAPITDASRWRVIAERQWLDLGARIGVPTHVFRLPGIYGPGGRSQFDSLKSGRAHRIVKPGQVFNRIHVEDLAAVVWASMQKRGGSPVYNVVDDEPAPADVVVAHAAELLGVPAPPEIAFEDAKLPPFAAHFYAECKRVRNDLIKSELGVTLRYPTYREGLAAIAAKE